MDGKRAGIGVNDSHYILVMLNFLVRFFLLFYKLSPDRDELFLFSGKLMTQTLFFAVKLKNFHCIAFDFGRHLIYNHWSDQFSR
jgi:hypothetical protein